MGLRIMHDEEQHMSCFYDSTSGVAFGPVVQADDSYEQLERFSLYLEERHGIQDVRRLATWGIMKLWEEFHRKYVDPFSGMLFEEEL